jgi:hypothetical protein
MNFIPFKKLFASFEKQTGWVWLFCIVLLSVQIGGAHLHVCFDGTEKTVSVHAGELNVQDEHSGIHHADTDLNLVDSGVTKTYVQLLHAPALIAALVVLCLHVVTRSIPSPTYAPPFFRFIPQRFSAPRAPPR